MYKETGFSEMIDNVVEAFIDVEEGVTDHHSGDFVKGVLSSIGGNSADAAMAQF